MEQLDKPGFGGVFTVEHIRDGQIIDTFEVHNVVTDEGLDYMLDVGVVNGTKVGTHYVGIFEGNYSPTGAETGGTVSSLSTECTTYANGTRPTYVPAAVASQTTTNSASKASFVFTADKAVYGAFLSGDSTKGGTGSICLAIARFPGVRNVLNTDELQITYTLTAQDVV